MKNIIKTLAASLFILSTNALFATDYYVDASRANDNGTGTTLLTAKRTLQAIVTNVALKGGDVVYVKGGTYTVAGTQAVLSITKSGSAALGNIVFRNVAGETPLIEFNGTNGIEVINGSSYIEINGFEIKGYKGATDTRTVAGAETQYANYATCATPTYNAVYAGNGIIVKDNDNNVTTDNSHHITIRNCNVHDCGGGGIAILGGDYITVEDNEVYRNAFYSFYANSGISIYQPYNFDATTGYKIVIQRNKSYGNDSKIKWTNGCKFSDGNGIILDDYRNTQNTSAYGIYTGKTLVANNITFGNGGSGIHAYSSNNIDIVHNVSYQNGQRTATYNDGGIYGNATTNVRILNNIIVGITGKRVNTNFNNTNHVIAYNSFFGGLAPTLSGTGIVAASSINNLTTDPLFTNPSLDPTTADFHISNTSPAANSGLNFSDVTTDFEGTTRSTTGVDRGAYEVVGVVPVELIEFKGDPSVSGTLLTWKTATEINTTHFDIERSNDGKSFERIGTTKAQGSRSTYQFIDEKQLNGSTYYRLKINDLDGKITFSNTVNVSTVGKSKVKIYPSVSNGNLTVEGAKSFEIINAFGQVVLSETDAIQPQLRGIEAASFTIHHLKSGIYIVHGVDTAGGLFVEKIVKQ
jgi:parallel beta-helix repeat protein